MGHEEHGHGEHKEHGQHEGHGEGHHEGHGGHGHKGKAKVKKPKERDPQEWEEENFPTIAEREVDAVQAKMDPVRLGEMRAKVKKKLKEAMGQDPATLTRQWKIKITLTGIENTTNQDWEVFVAVSMATTQELNEKKNRLKGQFGFTKSYILKKAYKKQLKSMEVLFNIDWKGSYKELTQTEVCFDMWLVSSSNFNQILGTARKTLYDMANESVFQSVFVKPNQEMQSTAFDIGVLYINALVQEIMEFTITASNWQFAPRPDLRDHHGGKHCVLSMPKKEDGAADSFETCECKGPRYCWANAGEFTYMGTKVSLSMEALSITLFNGAEKQGKAIVSLGVAGEYPIAMGVVKTLTKDVKQFVQGRIGGSLSVACKSFLLKAGTHDEDPSIPAPSQPAHTLVIFHLSPNLQYLVVEMNGADGLPVADLDSGSSNPMCRVKYDGMVQQSPVIEGTLSPTWSHTFYIPVRVFDEKIIKDPEYMKALLPHEMKSKGFLDIEIWHFDAVPSEYLGGFRLDPQQTRYGEQEKKAICQKASGVRKFNNAGEAEEESDLGISPALAKKHVTKVYDARRVKLTGSWLQSVTKGTVTFQCYFIPDFPENFKFPEQAEDGKGDSMFEASYKKWDALWPQFMEAYTAWFPDAPQKRRFLCNHANSAAENIPLASLVSPLALPASLATPIKVMHWIKCVEFSVPPRQRACAEVTTWQRPEDVLSLRKGSVQDHAVLLCCALQGLGKQAYVCKGTVQKGKEHVWVMTRESGKTVTFWETTTGAKFHLPKRWNGHASHSSQSKDAVAERWKHRHLNSKWKDKESVQARSQYNRTMHLESMSDLLHLPIAPWKELYDDDHIVAVPYETIEVVFNGVQVWGNLGNHHPCCIYYDMEDDHRSWYPLLDDTALPHLLASKGVAIPVGPSISKYTAEQLQEAIENELKESVRMIRMRQGHESYFEDDQVLQETLEQYLEFMEDQCVLESDWTYDDKDKLRKPWAPGAQTPFNSVVYQTACRTEWAKYWKRKKVMEDARVFFPVKENYMLSGIPLHFSSSDVKEIRKYLLVCKPMLEYFGFESDDVIFFACVKVFAMPSSIASVWVFLGAEIPIPEDKLLELAQAQMKQMMDKEEDEIEKEDE